MDSLPDKARRKRRAEGINWSPEDERDWLKRHPEDRPEGWVDEDTFFATQPDLVPDIKSDIPDDGGLQDFLDRIDIFEAYARFCGKMTPVVKGKRESIMIRCPDPTHLDEKTSAWINADLQVYNCEPCQYGGDKFDIYALNRGWGKNYKPSFHKMKREMAMELGWREPEATITPVLDPSETDDGGTDTRSTNPGNPVLEPLAPILEFPPQRQDQGLSDYRIDWESIVPPETFLWEWMQSTAQADDLPHEFYFWLGIQALGFAAGTDVWMPDQRNIKANFFVCNYGKTGSGKTRANQAFIELLHKALPWAGDEYTESKGVQILYSPGSSEALLKSFQHEILDPVTNEIKYLAPVKGLLLAEEFAAFIAKAARPGGNLKERLIELYDVFRGDVTHYSLSGGKIMAHAPFCQMLTTTQPLAIHTFTNKSDIESGFLNRWVFGIGPRRRRRMAHGGASIDVTDAAERLYRTQQWCDSGKVMPLSGTALQTWEKFFYADIEDLVEHSEESIYSRIDLTLKKLIIAMTVNQREDIPTPETVDKVATLLPYLQRSLAMFGKDVSYSEADDCIHRIVELVTESTKTKANNLTKRELTRRLTRKFSNETIRKAISTAYDLGLINMSLTKNDKGRPTESYTVL